MLLLGTVFLALLARIEIYSAGAVLTSTDYRPDSRRTADRRFIWSLAQRALLACLLWVKAPPGLPVFSPVKARVGMGRYSSGQPAATSSRSRSLPLSWASWFNPCTVCCPAGGRSRAGSLVPLDVKQLYIWVPSAGAHCQAYSLAPSSSTLSAYRGWR